MKLEQFYDLMDQAASTNQKPTEWQFGKGVEERVKAGQGHVLLGIIGREFLGIPYFAKVVLPEGRVVLKAGENTVGAFTIETDGKP